MGRIQMRGGVVMRISTIGLFELNEVKAAESHKSELSSLVVGSKLSCKLDHPMRWLVVLLLLHVASAFRMPSMGKATRSNPFPRQMERAAAAKTEVATNQRPFLLPKPPTEALANFIDKSHEDKRFLVCNLIANADINGIKYGVGFPMDMPVMLTYFEDNQLKPVKPDYPDYDHLVAYVDNSLDDGNLKLYNTPVVLTLEGEFEEEEFNQVNPFELHQSQQAKKQAKRGTAGLSSTTNPVGGADKSARENSKANNYDAQDDFTTTSSTTTDLKVGDDEEDEGVELSLEELLYSEDIPIDEGAYDASDIEEEDDADQDVDTNLGSHTTNTHPNTDTNTPTNRYTTYNPDATSNIDSDDDVTVIPASQLSQFAHLDLPHFDPRPEQIVTEEDTKSLNRAHRRADRIMEYATDMKLMGSFHYEKKNFHLVRLLEPIFVVGRKMDELRGSFFSLLSDDEAAEARPIIEQLLVERSRESATTTDDTAETIDTTTSPVKSRRGTHTKSFAARARAKANTVPSKESTPATTAATATDVSDSKNSAAVSRVRSAHTAASDGTSTTRTTTSPRTARATDSTSPITSSATSTTSRTTATPTSTTTATPTSAIPTTPTTPAANKWKSSASDRTNQRGLLSKMGEPSYADRVNSRRQARGGDTSVEGEGRGEGGVDSDDDAGYNNDDNNDRMCSGGGGDRYASRRDSSNEDGAEYRRPSYKELRASKSAGNRGSESTAYTNNNRGGKSRDYGSSRSAYSTNTNTNKNADSHNPRDTYTSIDSTNTIPSPYSNTKSAYDTNNDDDYGDDDSEPPWSTEENVRRDFGARWGAMRGDDGGGRDDVEDREDGRSSGVRDGGGDRYGGSSRRSGGYNGRDGGRDGGGRDGGREYGSRGNIGYNKDSSWGSGSSYGNDRGAAYGGAKRSSYGGGGGRSGGYNIVPAEDNRDRSSGGGEYSSNGYSSGGGGGGSGGGGGRGGGGGGGYGSRTSAWRDGVSSSDSNTGNTQGYGSGRSPYIKGTADQHRVYRSSGRSSGYSGSADSGSADSTKGSGYRGGSGSGGYGTNRGGGRYSGGGSGGNSNGYTSGSRGSYNSGSGGYGSNRGTSSRSSGYAGDRGSTGTAGDANYESARNKWSQLKSRTDRR